MRLIRFEEQKRTAGLQLGKCYQPLGTLSAPKTWSFRSCAFLHGPLHGSDVRCLALHTFVIPRDIPSVSPGDSLSSSPSRCALVVLHSVSKKQPSSIYLPLPV
ncbi:hypothetical protein BD289DRAFT_426193 [Coniella lustricola]|uniref:Uncharacterized protein n=1 Tax=Coniella lustricola TaxID=2025994 RepID=A0A2T3AGU5_9PEZI|nr:hypothetical protein BD289DRAFT_426193 [Coniella lustricola]